MVAESESECESMLWTKPTFSELRIFNESSSNPDSIDSDSSISLRLSASKLEKLAGMSGR